MSETNERPGSGISKPPTESSEEIVALQSSLRILNQTVVELTRRITTLESKAKAEKTE